MFMSAPESLSDPLLAKHAIYERNIMHTLAVLPSLAQALLTTTNVPL